MKRKTITSYGKRYPKTKPSDLYIVSVYSMTYSRDEDGEQIDESDETILNRKAMSLKELLALIEEHTGTSECDTNGDSMYFDSEYHEHWDGSESRWTVSVMATEQRIDRLHKIAAPDQYRRQNARRIKNELQERKNALKAKFEVINGDNPFCSRPSQAKLSLVS